MLRALVSLANVSYLLKSAKVVFRTVTAIRRMGVSHSCNTTWITAALVGTHVSRPRFVRMALVAVRMLLRFAMVSALTLRLMRVTAESVGQRAWRPSFVLMADASVRKTRSCAMGSVSILRVIQGTVELVGRRVLMITRRLVALKGHVL